MPPNDNLRQYERYAPLVGQETVQRIREKAEALGPLRIAHFNSTYYGGGVAELLSSLTILMNSTGLRSEWRVLQGAPDFFSVTKKIHNALQGGEINLTDLKKEIYEGIVHENALRNFLDHDVVIIHDPQPLPMVNEYRKGGPWIWRCHIDLTRPNQEVWNYIRGYVEKFDAAILTLEEYKQDMRTPQVFFMPAIDPFTIKNRPLDPADAKARLDYHGIPTDAPLVVQISRFDHWKDPQGVIAAFNLIRDKVDARLVLLGNVATDDPEGEEIYHSLLDQVDDRVIILSREDTALVNALQSQAAVVLQKSIREGFGLTVTEAMWKGAAVIGGNVGGIRYQIEDGENGFLVSSIEETAERIHQLLKDPALRKRLGDHARESVRQRFLMTRLLEQYLDLLGAFETVFLFHPSRGDPQHTDSG